MIQSAHSYTLSELLNPDKPVVYEVPRYQREYNWTRDQWNDLFEDIVQNESGYFLGSIICINQTKDAVKDQKLEVVDGQQRLTTLSLFLTAVYEVLNAYRDQLDDDQRSELTNLKYKLITKHDKNQPRFMPQRQNDNFRDYLAVLADIEIMDRSDKPPNAGNRRIFYARRYLYDRLMDHIKESGDEVKSILNIIHKLNTLCVVKIEVGSHADAYALFEALNYRGTPLTAIDLIKNKLLKTLDGSDNSTIDKYYEEWGQLLDYLGDNYATQERFFRQYYNAFRNVMGLREIANESLAARSNIIRIYERLINAEPRKQLRQMVEAGREYAKIILSDSDAVPTHLGAQLESLDRIQGAPSHLLLMYLLVRRDAHSITDGNLAEVVNLLVRYFVRRNITNSPPTRQLDRIFMGVVDSLRNEAGLDVRGQAVVESIRTGLKQNLASDATFREKLSGALYEDNKLATRFILCALEESNFDRESQRNLWQPGTGKQYVWSIEHVFPQGGIIPTSWVEMMANGNRAEADAMREKHVHRLGNLTITGYNSTLGAKSFEEKQNRMDANGRAIGYRNGLWLNKDLATVDRWSVEQIGARTERLVDEALRLFSLDNTVEVE